MSENKLIVRIIEESEDNRYGKFKVDSLAPGIGLAIGNALRRILLSSIPGSAISQIKIEGVLHEFSSIPGVMEDVTEIIANIKQIAIRNNSETDETKTVYIEYEGEGIITAGDIQTDSDVAIMNPELVIAHMNGGADSKLFMELTITKGRGYVSADRNKTEDMPIAVLPIDSIYCPVKKVNINVETDEETGTESLTVEMDTNKTICPHDAIALAARVMMDHLVGFMEPDIMSGQETMDTTDDAPSTTLLDMTVDELELTVRSYNCLKRANINTVEDLISHSLNDMLKIRNLGQKSRDEIVNKITELGLSLRQEDEF